MGRSTLAVPRPIEILSGSGLGGESRRSQDLFAG